MLAPFLLDMHLYLSAINLKGAPMGKTARDFIGETLGTFIMCFFGIGAVATATLFGAHTDPFQVGMVWGLAIAVAIYVTRNLSCAHFNPAVSVAMCCAKRLPWRELPIYLIGQCVGAFLAAALLWALFGGTVAAQSVAGWADGSESAAQAAAAAASIWAEPFPNHANEIVSPFVGALAEGIGVCLLLIVIFSNAEDANVGKPGNNIWPLFVGLTIFLGICTVGPITDAGFNPARDLMPRLWATLVGMDGAWSWAVINVYVVGPIVGGIVGALIWLFILEPAHKAADRENGALTD